MKIAKKPRMIVFTCFFSMSQATKKSVTHSNDSHVVSVNLLRSIELSDDGWIRKRDRPLSKDVKLSSILEGASSKNKTRKGILMAFLIKDLFSTLEYIELVSASDPMPISIFLFKAWRRKQIFPMIGPPAVLCATDELLDLYPDIEQLFPTKLTHSYVEHHQTVTASVKSYENEILFILKDYEAINFNEFSTIQFLFNSYRAGDTTSFNRNIEEKYVLGLSEIIPPFNDFTQFQNQYFPETRIPKKQLKFLRDRTEEPGFPKHYFPIFPKKEYLESWKSREVAMEKLKAKDGFRKIVNRFEVKNPVYAAFCGSAAGLMDRGRDFYVMCEHGTTKEIGQLSHAESKRFSDPRQWCKQCADTYQEPPIPQGSRGIFFYFELEDQNIYPPAKLKEKERKRKLAQREIAKRKLGKED